MSTSIDDRIHVPDPAYAALAEAVGSESSPVGIDARKTHVIILHILLDLQDRLDRIESRLERLETG
jgi:hypothetical protein